MTAIVIVHLNQSWPDALMRGYREGDELQRRAFSTDQLMKPGHELTDAQLCELAFHVFNAPDEILVGLRREIATEYRMKGLRSLSVGDLVEIRRHAERDAFYAVEPFDWCKVDPPAGWLHKSEDDVARERGISARPLDERGIARLNP